MKHTHIIVGIITATLCLACLIRPAHTEDIGAGVEWRTLDEEALELSEAGKYDQAATLAQRALEVAEQNVGPNHPDTAISLCRLAEIYCNQCHYSKAEPLCMRALSICERIQEKDERDLRVASVLSVMTRMYQGQHDYKQAIVICRRESRIYERIFGGESLYSACKLNKLARLHYLQGECLIAEPLYKRAISLLEFWRMMGEPELMVCLNNLAMLYASQHKYAQAEPLYKRSLKIAEKVHGPNHHNVANILYNLAALCRATNRVAEARKLDERVKRIRAIKK